MMKGRELQDVALADRQSSTAKSLSDLLEVLKNREAREEAKDIEAAKALTGLQVQAKLPRMTSSKAGKKQTGK